MIVWHVGDVVLILVFDWVIYLRFLGGLERVVLLSDIFLFLFFLILLWLHLAHRTHITERAPARLTLAPCAATAATGHATILGDALSILNA